MVAHGLAKPFARPTVSTACANVLLRFCTPTGSNQHLLLNRERVEVAGVEVAREREVMRLIARGYAYKEVARELFISVKTVETHVSSVLHKLQLSSRHELTRWAADRRLL